MLGSQGYHRERRTQTEISTNVLPQCFHNSSHPLSRLFNRKVECEQESPKMSYRYQRHPQGPRLRRKLCTASLAGLLRVDSLEPTTWSCWLSGPSALDKKTPWCRETLLFGLIDIGSRRPVQMCQGLVVNLYVVSPYLSHLFFIRKHPFK
jgi:hypothetical protein